jgi:hypothetical protein
MRRRKGDFPMRKLALFVSMLALAFPSTALASDFEGHVFNDITNNLVNGATVSTITPSPTFGQATSHCCKNGIPGYYFIGLMPEGDFRLQASWSTCYGANPGSYRGSTPIFHSTGLPYTTYSHNIRMGWFTSAC